jgi:D-sedoheptulose 7-phosphate isomerase
MIDFNKRLNEFSISLNDFQVEGIDKNKIKQEEGLNSAVRIIKDLIHANKNLFIIGNGGSSGIASHAANDFINMCGLKCQTFHDISVLTCMTNDYGYDVTYQKLLENFSNENDCLIAISSSGNSLNIINATEKFRELNPKGKIITLSGFSQDNQLRNKGDLNFWIDSKSYGIVEIAHQFILHFFADKIYQEIS